MRYRAGRPGPPPAGRPGHLGGDLDDPGGVADPERLAGGGRRGRDLLGDGAGDPAGHPEAEGPGDGHGPVGPLHRQHAHPDVVVGGRHQPAVQGAEGPGRAEDGDLGVGQLDGLGGRGQPHQHPGPDLCMQLQANILGVEVSKPVVAETTALGAAYAAGLAVGFWSTTDELRENWNEDKRWSRSGPRSSARTGTRVGRRRSSAHWTGWTSTIRSPAQRSRSSMRAAHCRPTPGRRLDAMAAGELDVLVVGGGVVGSGRRSTR